MLLPALLAILEGWLPAFSQSRSGRRAMMQALGGLMALGRRTLSRSLWALGRQQQDWSADYRLHARAQWNPQALFRPVIEQGLPFCKGPFVVVAMDDTRLRKTGRKILSAFYQRDPLSPKFRFNLMWGLRFFHVSLLLPLYRTWEQAAPRSVPIRFVEVPALKRPRRKAAPEDWSAYRRAVKHHNLSQQGVRVIRELRGSLDQAGGGARVLLAVGDGSFCNRTLFRIELDRTQVLARARKDIRLCYRAAAPSRSFYSAEKFTPELVRQNEDVAWETAAIFHGGQCRQVRFKQVPDVYWQTGGRKRPLRLLVVAPIPYAGGNGRKKYYRDAAYLLTTDNSASAEALLQAYFDRWQIEVNHREMKDTLGVGQAQVRNCHSVSRQPALAVAAYSALLLAGVRVFGPDRGSAFPELPKWRRKANRPSCLDLVTVLRSELTESNADLSALVHPLSWPLLGKAAAA